MALLELDHVNKRFGGLLAVSNVTFGLDKGEILSMIGPNGAGKTTAFNCITGLFPITSGSITLDGEFDRRHSPTPDHEARRCTHLSEHPSVQLHDCG